MLFVIKKSLTKKRKIRVITTCIKKDNKKLEDTEKEFLEFAKIHNDNGTTYAAAPERILLSNSTRTLFAVDFGYHRHGCYINVTVGNWSEVLRKKQKETDKRYHEIRFFGSC